MFKTDELECCFLLLCIYLIIFVYIYILYIYIYYSLNNLNFSKLTKRQRCLPEKKMIVRLAAGNVHPPWAWDPGPW